jgi:5-methylcytosine-specific restriction endonuclease McrA
MPPLPSAPSSTPAPRIQPTAADRYRISFTADEELVQVLDEVRDLLAHQVQRADVAAVFKRALRSLRDDLERQRKASTKRPSKQPTKPAQLEQPKEPRQRKQPEQAKQAPTPSTTAPATPPVPSRHVPNAIRREVWRRDGGRCTFTSATGQRCSETSLLELDHLRPFAVHHEHRADEITLRCRSHNQWGATLVYGRAHMARFRRRRR